MPFFILVLFIPSSSQAFLNWVGEEARRATEVAAYADAVSELAGEIAPNEELKEGAKDINARAERLRKEASNLRYISRSTQAILNGPDWSSRRLETNIRNTTDYVRKIKRLIARISILGTSGATALNTTETNIALNEVQKNQQALLLQNEDAKLLALERENEEAKQWAEFSQRQKSLRGEGKKNGKLR